MSSDPQFFSILVLDDVQISARLVQMILERNLNCKVTICLTAEEVFRLSEEGLPDLYILDIQLAEGSGIDVCYKLRQDPEKSAIPIIFLSAHGNPTMRVSALKSGGVDFLDKPFFPEELIARTRGHLNLYAANVRIQKQLAENQALLRVLGHDLKNPISNAFSLLEVIKFHNTGDSSYVDLALKSCEQAMELISYVATQGELLEASTNYPEEDLVLKDMIGESIAMLNSAAEKKGIKIFLEVPDNLVLRTNRITFSHNIINNLLNNAIKFSHDDGEIHIIATLHNSPERSGIEISICDTGIGMPATLVEAIEKDVPIESRSGTRNESGTGQGMKLVKRYVEKLGGTFAIESQEKLADTPESESGTRIFLFFKKPV